MIEENELKKQRHCWDCRFYDELYTKGYTSFRREVRGICVLTKKMTFHSNGCEKWIYRSHKKIKLKDTIVKTLDEMATHVAEMAQILKEDCEENDS